MSVYRVYRFAEFLVRWLPEPTARRASCAVGRLFCHLQRRNRSILLENLKVAFRSMMTSAELSKLRSDIFGSFGRFVYEFVHLPHVTRATADDIFTPGSLDEALRLGKMATEGPVISVTAHLGHWELGAAAVAIAGYPIAVLVDFHPDPRVTRFFDDIRKSRGVVPVPVTSAHKLFRALNHGTLVAIVADRSVTRQGITMEYFGRDFQAPDGYAVLARRFGAKIVPTFCIEQSDGRYRFFTEEPIEIVPSDDAEADIRNCVAKVLKIIERHVHTYPEQWYAFRPIWGLPHADRMCERRDRVLLWRRRSDELAREAVRESHRLRERPGRRTKDEP